MILQASSTKFQGTVIPILFIYLFLEMESGYVAQAGLLGSSHLPTSASRSARIVGVSHHAWP